MNYFISILMLLMALPTQIFGMYTTFYKPTHWQEKPRIDRNNMTSYDLAYTHAWASQSFDNKGKKAPLLTFVNPEPLLPSFVDCNVACKDNKPICYANIDGKYSFDGIHNEIIQNIYKRCFIQLNVPLCKAQMNDVVFTPTDKCGNTITPTTEINDYLNKLYLRLFKSETKHNQEKIYIGPSFLFFGYTNSFTDLKHADLLDLTFKVGLIIPIIHLEGPTLSDFLHGEIVNYGVPAQLQLMAGFYDWLNVGGAVGMIAFIPSNGSSPVNQAPYPNKIIVPKRELIQVYHRPIFTLTAYIEGEHFLPYWTWYIGFNFVKHEKTTWHGCPEQSYIAKINNEFPIIIPWLQGALTLSSEFDFSKDEKKLMPRLRIMYVKRIFGRDCLDAAVGAGAVGFEILYDF